MTKFINYLSILFIAISVSSCSMNNSNSDYNKTNTNELPYAFSNFSDIPIPEKAEMDIDRTSIFGRDSDWLGKIVFKAPYSVGGIFDFYMEEMPKFNWIEVTSVRGYNSVLTFKRDSRVALIQLIPSTFAGTQVIFTVSPEPAKNKIINMKNHQVKQKILSSVNVEKQESQNKFIENKNNNLTNEININNHHSKQNEELAPMNVTDSNLFISSDARKAMAGSLGLGEASNLNFRSYSKGVGVPPKQKYY